MKITSGNPITITYLLLTSGKKERTKQDSKHFCKHLQGILGTFPKIV